MNKFTKDLIGTTIISTVAVPLTIIGMGIGGYIWGEKIEPKIHKKKNESTSLKEKES